METETAEGDPTAPEPAAASEVEAVPEKGQQKKGGCHTSGVGGEEARAPQSGARGRGDGEDRAEDGTRAETGKTVNGAQAEGRHDGDAFDLLPQAFDRPERDPPPASWTTPKAMMRRPETVIRMLL